MFCHLVTCSKSLERERYCVIRVFLFVKTRSKFCILLLHAQLYVCVFVQEEGNTIPARSAATSSASRAQPTEPLQRWCSCSDLCLYLGQCFGVMATFYVWNSDREESATTGNTKQLVKLARNKVGSVILTLNGRFWRNADVIREITRIDGDFYRFYREFWIILSTLQIDGPRSSVWF